MKPFLTIVWVVVILLRIFLFFIPQIKRYSIIREKMTTYCRGCLLYQYTCSYYAWPGGLSMMDRTRHGTKRTITLTRPGCGTVVVSYIGGPDPTWLMNLTQLNMATVRNLLVYRVILIHATTISWSWISCWNPCHWVAWFWTWHPISRSCGGTNRIFPCLYTSGLLFQT